jgi:hypothetical protein
MGRHPTDPPDFDLWCRALILLYSYLYGLMSPGVFLITADNLGINHELLAEIACPKKPPFFIFLILQQEK